jgi:hypothetical protein
LPVWLCCHSSQRLGLEWRCDSVLDGPAFD